LGGRIDGFAWAERVPVHCGEQDYGCGDHEGCSGERVCLSYDGRVVVEACHEPAVEVPSLHTHPQLPALGGYLVQVAFMTVSAFVVARLSNNPAVVRQADALSGATFVIATPVVLLSAVHWHALGHHSIVGAPTSGFPHSSGVASPGAPRFVSRTIPPAS
jgi:hypothetical protein